MQNIPSSSFINHQSYSGFPSSADDFVERKLDLNRHLIQNPTATFFLRAQGDEMADFDIHDGDIIIVDRSKHPAEGNLVVAGSNGELTLQRAQSFSAEYIPSSEGEESAEVWGVVIWIVHKAM